MHIAALSVENIRSIASCSLEIDVSDLQTLKHPNVHVILGNNGAGKSTLLRAIALAVLAPGLADTGFRPEGYVRMAPSGQKSPDFGTAQVALTLHQQDRTEGLPTSLKLADFKIKIERLGDGEKLRWERPTAHAILLEKTFYTSSTSAFFLAAYGATRRVEASERVDLSAREKSRSPRYQRVASLFEEHVALMPLSFWLPEFKRRNPGRHKQVVNLMNGLLPAGCKLLPEPRTGKSGIDYLFEFDGVTVPFGGLSDGYRAYAGWIADMLYHICMGSPKGAMLRNSQGVIMIDEVGLHLHPEWQRTVVPTLAEQLPNMQFFVTTHSPIVVGSLEARNIFLLQRRESASVLVQLPERVRGLSSEQILLSPYFGLESTREPESARRMRELTTQAASRDGRRAAVEYMKLMLPSSSTVAATSAVATTTTSAKTKVTAKKAAPVKRALVKKSAAKKRANSQNIKR